MDTTTEGALGNWFLLMDPAWRPTAEDDEPPLEAVAGVWSVGEDGALGRFRANPDYRPTDENSPSDPLDAALRLLLHSRAETRHIQLVLRETLVDLAVNPDGRPLVAAAPDGVPCVVVATGQPHRARLTPPAWHRVDLDELVITLPDDVDVLFNPAGPAPVRLTGDFIRETLLLDDEEIAAAHPESRPATPLRVFPWDTSTPQ
ncbi:type VII secretion system-associated protein [Actinokineospora pegani]|uniref:type VII secretion system-associated protein n=1 Tax=Actinokineospora pegani TaxID=2654637 RepID=UPI0012EACECD|nr:type VII secretion system-associated protein [Actinokineospora pegani]